LRDMTCRFPGCDRSAVICDVDHTVPFNHADPRNGGLTVPWNLKCLCRQHHRDKTFDDGWRDEQVAVGPGFWTRLFVKNAAGAALSACRLATRTACAAYLPTVAALPPTPSA
jgi:hypothetical protein